MLTTITETSKELITRLFNEEFESIDMSMDYIYGKMDKLIKAAREFGLDELANRYEQEKNLVNNN